jgi:hypothetical protein
VDTNYVSTSEHDFRTARCREGCYRTLTDQWTDVNVGLELTGLIQLGVRISIPEAQRYLSLFDTESKLAISARNRAHIDEQKRDRKAYQESYKTLCRDDLSQGFVGEDGRNNDHQN